MHVVRKAVQHLNAGQTPVVTFDQPLYAFAKQIQWKWQDMYGNDKLVVMFGGLHIEMAAPRTLCDWLQGSGWVEALVQHEIKTAGTTDSLHTAHVARARRMHITAAALYILQYPTYNSHVIGAVFTGLCAVAVAVFLQHVRRCYDIICPLLLCSGPHQLCPLDPSSSP